MPTRSSARRRLVATIVTGLRPSPELVILIATLVSALNALDVLDLVRLSGVHLAVANIGLASVLGLVGRGLVPSEPPQSLPAPRRAQHSERGSTS